jgi:hypothetical protein
MTFPIYSSFSDLANSTGSACRIPCNTVNTLEGAASAAQALDGLATLYAGAVSAKSDEYTSEYLEKMDDAAQQVCYELDDAENNGEFEVKGAAWNIVAQRTALFRDALTGLRQYKKVLTQKSKTQRLAATESAFLTDVDRFQKAFERISRAKPDFSNTENVLNSIQGAIVETETMGDILTQLYAALETFHEEQQLVQQAGKGEPEPFVAAEDRTPDYRRMKEAQERQNIAVMEADKQAAYLADAIRETAAELNEARDSGELEPPPSDNPERQKSYEKSMEDVQRLQSTIKEAEKALKTYAGYQPYIDGATGSSGSASLRQQDVSYEVSAIAKAGSDASAALRSAQTKAAKTQKTEKLKDVKRIAGNIDEVGDYWD